MRSCAVRKAVKTGNVPVHGTVTQAAIPIIRRGLTGLFLCRGTIVFS